MAACGIGIATGASVVAFNDAIHAIRDVIWHGESTLLSGRQLLQQFSEFELAPRIVLPPVVGGLFVGLLALAAGGYADPPPLPASLSGDEAGWRQRAEAVLRPAARAVAAAVTLGTGASLGPEGPSVDIGRSFAKGVNSLLRAPERHLTALVAAGSGAGVAAGFNAPIAGVFFAVETVLQRQLLRTVAAGPSAGAKAAQRQAQRMQDSSALTVAMVLLASVLAAVVSQAGLGSSPAFRVPEYRLQSLYELPLFVLFGALCGAVSASFSYSARVADDAFSELRRGPSGAALLPALGGLTTGVLALGYPEIMYQGFDNVTSVLSSNGEYAPGLLIQIVVLKIIATTISRGSGLQGGLYAPSIFIGAALGSAFGLMVHGVGDPAGLVLSAPQAYALVGVAAMLASNCGVPLTAVLLLFELTRDYLIIVPTLGAVGISFWISSLAAPGVRDAAARRARRRAASLAAASAVAGGAPGGDPEPDLLASIKERLLDGALLQQEGASESAGPPGGGALPAGLSLSLEGGGDEDGIVLACDADAGCLLLRDDLSLAAALALMEAEGQAAAVVVGRAGGVVGLVSRDVERAGRLMGGGAPKAERQDN